METCDNTAKLVNNTYRTVIDELGPCIKQLVAVGRIYLKSIHGMMAASRNYNEAVNRVAVMADNSTLSGSTDLGAALHHLVDINRELQAQKSNIVKSLEFDFLEAMEIAADKDTKLIGREHKRFLQMHKSRKEAFEKSISTLKKSKRKKSVNADKQIAQMKLMESTRSRLEEFCDESLKEAVVQERIMYGTVLDRQSAFNKQLLVYFHKGCDLLQDNIPHWQVLAESKNAIPRHCVLVNAKCPQPNECSLYTIGGNHDLVESPVETVTRRRQMNAQHRRTMASDPRFDDGAYARPMVRAKSEHNLSNIIDEKPVAAATISRFSRLIEYNGDLPRNYVKVVYPFHPKGEHEMTMAQEDVIRFSGPPSTSGWQFGNNLTTNRHGWFPLSYTELINCLEDSPPSSRSSTLVDDDYIMPQRISSRAPNPGPSYQHSRPNLGAVQSDSSDYGTLKKTTSKKPLPVQPPELPTLGYGNPKTRGSQPDLTYSDTGGKPRTLYKHVPLQSLHL